MTSISIDWTEIEVLPNETIFCEICCTEDVKPEDQTKCAKGHAFCKTCAAMMAQRQITNFQTSLPFMSMNECEAEFEEEEAAKFLNKVLYKKWKELHIEKFAKELGIKQSLEFCPFCDFNRVELSTSQAQTFICGNSDCGKWTCRECKEEDYSPLSCEEAEKILKNVEDQKAKFIFEATVRRCPSKTCGLAFEKDDGCNRMKCKQCKTKFCYICKEDISESDYGHFEASLGLCGLHDDPTSLILGERGIAEKEFEKIHQQQNFVKERKQALQDAIVQAREKEEERLLRQQQEEKRINIMQNEYFREYPSLEDMQFINARR